jgi:hypothetical protein
MHFWPKQTGNFISGLATREAETNANKVLEPFGTHCEHRQQSLIDPATLQCQPIPTTSTTVPGAAASGTPGAAP